jgi:hypothetical protein
MKLWNGFQERSAPGSGRRVIQLTTGPGTCYPLYYFIPSFTQDPARLIYHRAQDSEVQLHMLDLKTGSSLQLTNASAPRTRWIPWCVESGAGVLDHRSVLDVQGNRVFYFDGGEVHAVDLDSLQDRCLFSLPEDRIAIGQNCMSSDGEWLVYIHHDREGFGAVYPEGKRQAGDRSLSKGTTLAAYHLITGEQRNLVILNSPIHHVQPYQNNSFVFCHPTMENGMLYTDIRGGWYTHLRTQDEYGGCVCHHITTRRGIAYEVLGGSNGVWAGMYNPLTHQRYELRLPDHFGYTHTGWDPEGFLWFFENQRDVHDLHFLARHNPGGEDEWLQLCTDWPTYGNGQKAHFHPQVTPDRKWILMTAGDAETSSNHMFLLDIADLQPTSGILW